MQYDAFYCTEIRTTTQFLLLLRGRDNVTQQVENLYLLFDDFISVCHCLQAVPFSNNVSLSSTCFSFSLEIYSISDSHTCVNDAVLQFLSSFYTQLIYFLFHWSDQTCLLCLHFILCPNQQRVLHILLFVVCFAGLHC